jgi:aromatic-L-amino-acid decarboxylase
MTDHTTLDPEDWDGFRKAAHAALDAAIAHVEHRRDLPVWTRVPDDLRRSLTAALPGQGRPAGDLAARMAEDFLPFGVGNTHPRFFGWVHGAGNIQGVIPDMFAAALNANLGGRDHVANEVEKQVIAWVRDMFGFPDTAGGLVVSGTSMATVIALKAARERAGGLGLRKTGVAAAPGLVGYASAEAHSCIARAFDMLGLGSDALRKVPVDDDFRMRTGALADMIAEDRARGLAPFCVVGTAGAVNTGAIDALDDLAALAAAEGMWFHVDGAFGALGVLADEVRPRLAGIERADSLAFDFHKWAQVNYDAGFVLVRDAEDQRRAFSERPDYLEGATRGLAAGNPWFTEYGPELSRGFRALKIWFHLAHFGTDRLGQVVAANCASARHLEARVRTEAALEILAPAQLNIVCFRWNPGGMDAAALDAANAEIVIRLHESGIAAPSVTRVGGKQAIRVNITNHRTVDGDLDILVDAVLEIAGAL